MTDFRRPMLVLFSLIALAGCGGHRDYLTWQRLDGRTIVGNPELERLFYADMAICREEADERAAHDDAEGLGNALTACMADRGYAYFTARQF